jgi:MFS family permease
MSSQAITASDPASASPSQAVPGARLALTLLLLINLFNYMDRQVLSAVVPRIKKDFFPESVKKDDAAAQAVLSDQEKAEQARRDKWVEAEIGTLSMAFMVAYMLSAPVFGFLADRMSRWWLVGIGVAVWSLASGGSGLATSFLILLVTRIFVGVGEGAYGPAAPALISDMYPVSRRGTVFAWFYVAIPVGSALGYILGAQMLNVSTMLTGTESWRWGFYAVVIPGMLLALLCFFMREPSRGQSDAVIESRHATWADYWIILRTPSFVYTTLGYTALTFVQGGLAFWIPHYVSENREQGNLAQSATIFGLIVLLSSLPSTLLGGWAGDRLQKKLPGAYLLVSAWGVFLAFPLTVAVVYVDFPYAWACVFAAVFCMFFNTGPVNTVMANVTHPSVRASAFALNILVIHLFGDAVSPSIMGGIAGISRELVSEGKVTGWLASVLAGHDGMDFTMLVTSLFLPLAGFFWLWGARHLERDTALAPQRVAHRPDVGATGNLMTTGNGASA